MTKKDRGYIKYQKLMKHVEGERAKKHRTRASDIAPKRIGDGISPKTYVHVPPEPKPITLASLLAAAEKFDNDQGKGRS